MSKPDWIRLSHALREEGQAFLGNRNTADTLREQYEQGLAVIRCLGNEVIAYAALWPTVDSHFVELGSVWVKPEHRGKQLGKEVAHELDRIARERPETVCMLTANERMCRVAETSPFTWIEQDKDQWDDTIPWTVSCGPCDRIPHDQKNNCSFKGKRGGCSLFVLEDKD